MWSDLTTILAADNAGSVDGTDNKHLMCLVAIYLFPAFGIKGDKKAINK
jgi:hypothetical protein